MSFWDRLYIGTRWEMFLACFEWPARPFAVAHGVEVTLAIPLETALKRGALWPRETEGIRSLIFGFKHVVMKKNNCDDWSPNREKCCLNFSVEWTKENVVT